MNKPHHTLAFMLLVAILYTSLSIIMPSSTFRVGDFLIRFPKPLEQFASHNKKMVSAKTDSIKPAVTSKLESIPEKSTPNLDSLSNTESIGARSDSPMLPKKSIDIAETLPLEMPQGITPLGSFMSAIGKNGDEFTMVRVLHYGDSQIEGDRITNQLRAVLQEKFGGKGLGLIPIWNTEYLPNGFRVSLSEHVNVNSTVNAKPTQKPDCVLGSIAEVAPSNSYREIVSIKVNAKQIINTLSIIAGNSDSSYVFKIIIDGTDTLEKHVVPYSKVNLVKVNLPSRFERISIQFRNSTTVKLYGLLAESGSGVSVCNIALRGTSGNFFNHFDSEVASEIYKTLNVRLVIMQFGINVVPSNLSSYAYYQKLIEQQINAVKRFAPQADILVVGVTDMANRFDGVLKSYPSVDKVLQAQRYAALSNGALFWDGYSAMGGEGSIIEWVNSKPPLATKDYTHFTNYGAKRFGQKLASALLIAIGNFNFNSSRPTVSPDSVSYE